MPSQRQRRHTEEQSDALADKARETTIGDIEDDVQALT